MSHHHVKLHKLIDGVLKTFAHSFQSVEEAKEFIANTPDVHSAQVYDNGNLVHAQDPQPEPVVVPEVTPAPVVETPAPVVEPTPEPVVEAPVVPVETAPVAPVVEETPVVEAPAPVVEAPVAVVEPTPVATPEVVAEPVVTAPESTETPATNA